MDLVFVSVHKHAKKGLGQYPAILTSHLVNNPYTLHFYLGDMGVRIRTGQTVGWCSSVSLTFVFFTYVNLCAENNNNSITCKFAYILDAFFSFKKCKIKKGTKVRERWAGSAYCACAERVTSIKISGLLPVSLRGSYTKKTSFFAKQLCRTVLTLR